jgi:hypothetical protein
MASNSSTSPQIGTSAEEETPSTFNYPSRPSPPYDIEPLPRSNASEGPAAEADTEEQNLPRWRRVFRNCIEHFNNAFFVITYPFMVILTVVGLFVVIAFCIFPTLLLAILVVGVYYCLMEDPVPLSVLLRYMLSAEEGDPGYPSVYAMSQERPVIQKKLIIRKLLKSEERNDDTQEAFTEQPRRHPLPITIVTEHMRLEFSEPLVIKEEDVEPKENPALPSSSPLDSVDEESGGIALQPLGHSNTALNLAAAAEEKEDRQDNVGSLDLPAGSEDDVPEAVKQTSSDEKDVSLDDCNIAIGRADEQNDDDKEDSEINDDYFGISETWDRGTTCDICLLDFEVGDFVAWSPNLECTHCFHNECLLDWLVRKNTCPSCRKDYLKGAKEDDA